MRWWCTCGCSCRELQVAVSLHLLSAGAVPPAGLVQHLLAGSSERVGLVYAELIVGAGRLLVHSRARPPGLSCSVNIE